MLIGPLLQKVKLRRKRGESRSDLYLTLDHSARWKSGNLLKLQLKGKKKRAEKIRKKENLKH